MKKQGSKVVYLPSAGAPKKGIRAPGLVGRIVRHFLAGLFGKSAAPARAPIARLRPVRAAPANVPTETACATEHEALALCQTLIQRGYLAEVRYDEYDYSWSAKARPAADGAHRSP